MTDPTPETPEQEKAPANVGNIIISYDPDDGEHQQWEFDPSRWTVGEVKLIESAFGKPRDDFFEDVNEGFETARIFMLWMVRRRTEPDLDLEDLDNLLSAAINLWQIEDPAALEAAEAEANDPQPDAVNQGKDTPSGSSGEPLDEQPQQPEKQPGPLTLSPPVARMS